MAGAINGRSVRVCDVVDAEMSMHDADPYSERVRQASRILRGDGRFHGVCSNFQIVE